MVRKKILKKPLALKSKPRRKRKPPSQPKVFSSKKISKSTNPSKPIQPLKKVGMFLAIQKLARMEILVFPKSKHPLTLKVEYLLQGFIILLLITLSAFFIIPQQKLDQSLVIKTSILKQNSTITTDGKPVGWTNWFASSN
jgi:hypothetical protein